MYVRVSSGSPLGGGGGSTPHTRTTACLPVGNTLCRQVVGISISSCMYAYSNTRIHTSPIIPSLSMTRQGQRARYAVTRLPCPSFFFAWLHDLASGWVDRLRHPCVRTPPHHLPLATAFHHHPSVFVRTQTTQTTQTAERWKRLARLGLAGGDQSTGSGALFSLAHSYSGSKPHIPKDKSECASVRVCV